MDAIVAETVCRQYGDTTALDGVSLTVPTGEIFALVGPNGAGKTTLVRAITGTTDAEGSVELFGKPPREVDTQKLGLLPQNFDPPSRLTARELLEYYGGLYDSAKPVEDVLADVGIADSADTYYENLSGGQQRRTCVASALVNDPELLILDEPTTGIDPAGRRTIWRLIEDLAATGKTVFLTTHYMEEAQQLADRVGLLSDGELVALDSPQELIATHGGASRLTITGSIPESVVNSLDYETLQRDDHIVILGIEPQEIGEVTRVLDNASVTYESLTWREPELEDVYLELTGQSVKSRPADGVDGSKPETNNSSSTADGNSAGTSGGKKK